MGATGCRRGLLALSYPLRHPDETRELSNSNYPDETRKFEIGNLSKGCNERIERAGTKLVTSAQVKYDDAIFQGYISKR